MKVALVGRPNVGKSALFNRICGKRIAIVDEAEGITRDRLYIHTEYFGKEFELIDTGGIDPKSKIPFQEEVIQQSEIAIEEADSIIMVVDGRIGVTALDEDVAKRLLRTKKQVTLAVNKIDDHGHLRLVEEFYSLGISKIVGVSAVQGFQVAELIEIALKGVETAPEEDVEQVKIAIVGRPNVGKSTLVNTLLDEKRCIVSPIPGTTRDSIDIPIEVNGKRYLLIDTAGIRKKKAEHEVVDKFAAVRTKEAIERCDLCVLVLDADRGMTTDEKRIAHMIEEQGKGCVILFNKWDTVKGHRMEHCLLSMREDVPFLSHCPTLFVSALHARNIEKIFPEVDQVYFQQTRRIGTSELNAFVEKAIAKNHPPMLQGKRLRIYYMTQVETKPPHFVLFVNRPALMTETYTKYLINQFREVYGFTGMPIRFSLKGKVQRTFTKNNADEER
jgi:GTP-binding protein